MQSVLGEGELFTAPALTSDRYDIARPRSYFSDMGVLCDMAKKGCVYLVGERCNKVSPIHGRDLVRGLVKFIALLSIQLGDLADFIVTAGETDSVGLPRGDSTLRSHFEVLHAGKTEA